MKYQKLIEQYRSKKQLSSRHPQRRAVEDRLFNALVCEMNTILQYNNRTKVRETLKPDLLNDSDWKEPEWLKGINDR